MDYKQQQEIVKYLAKLEKQLIKIYGDTYQEAVNIAYVREAIEQGYTFSWSNDRQAAAKLDKMLQQMTAKVETLIANGVAASYKSAETKVTGDVIKALGVRGKTQIAEATAICEQATADRRAAGQTAAAHINARRGGIEASARIWQQNAKKEIEIIVQNGIKEGKSPSEIAQSIRGYLVEPRRYEKSVYNPETGRLERSDASREYHPGQGVYRSSYKNALRMARTEMTQAYRQAEWESYQNNPLIKAYEIRLSGNHTTLKIVKGKHIAVPLTDICDKLAGVYPKTFKWVGWHPQCRCLMIPVMVSKSEFRDLLEARKADREAKRAGKEATAVEKFSNKTAAAKLPAQYEKWLTDNQQRIEAARKAGLKLPQWIVDNENIKPVTVAAAPVTPTSPNAPATLTVDQLKEWLENELKVAQEVGVEMGEQMTFEEANEQRGNPNYSSGGGYRINCQSCVVAHELRRRGFDVEAQKNTKRPGNLPRELSYKTNWAWIDPKTGAMPSKVNVSAYDATAKNPALRYTKKTFIENFDKATKEPGRYHVDWTWNGKRSGHIITFERLKDGTGRLYDPQNGKTHTWDEYIKTYNREIGEVSVFDITDVRVLRVDNMAVNTNIIKGIVAKSGSTKPVTKRVESVEDYKYKYYLKSYKRLMKWYDSDTEKVYNLWRKQGVPEDVIEGFKKYVSTKRIRITGTAIGGEDDAPISALPEIIRQRRFEIEKTARATLLKHSISHPKLKGEIRIYNRGIGEWLNQPSRHIAEKNEMLLNIGNVLRKSEYKGWNTYKGHKSHIFETELCGEKVWIVVSDIPGRGLAIHSISENANVLLGLKKD